MTVIVYVKITVFLFSLLDSAWGLNFVSEKDVRRFLKMISVIIYIIQFRPKLKKSFLKLFNI